MYKGECWRYTERTTCQYNYETHTEREKHGGQLFIFIIYSRPRGFSAQRVVNHAVPTRKRRDEESIKWKMPFRCEVRQQIDTYRRRKCFFFLQPRNDVIPVTSKCKAGYHCRLPRRITKREVREAHHQHSRSRKMIFRIGHDGGDRSICNYKKLKRFPLSFKWLKFRIKILHAHKLGTPGREMMNFQLNTKSVYTDVVIHLSRWEFSSSYLHNAGVGAHHNTFFSLLSSKFFFLHGSIFTLVEYNHEVL